MQDREIREAGVLVGVSLREVSRGVHRVHGSIAGRLRGALAAAVGLPISARRTAGPLTQLTYAAVGLGLVGAGHVGGHLLARSRADDLAAGDTADRVLALVNGSHGHLLAARHSPLALAASIRVAGTDVPLTPDGTRAAWPAATSTLAVYLHGLVDTERRWQGGVPAGGEKDGGGETAAQGREEAGAPDSAAPMAASLPQLLESELGLSPVFIRYNSGRRIEHSAQQVGDLIEQLVRVWPVEVTRIVLIGHSMGGLVFRRALVAEPSDDTGSGSGGGAGAGADAGSPGLREPGRRVESGSAGVGWRPLVTDLVTVGTPHGGAWLEQAVVRWSPRLAQLPETAWIGEQIDLRSDGIRDLVGPTPGDEDLPALPPAIREHAVVGTVTGAVGGAIGRRVGDLMVGVDSATGGLPSPSVAVFARVHHLGLARDPRVGQQLVRWLAQVQTAPD